MAITARFACAPTLFPSSKTLAYDRDEQGNLQIGCRVRLGRAAASSCRAFFGNGRFRKGCGISSINSCSFGVFLESCLVSNKVNDLQTKVRVAADYPDSKPDASPMLGDMGYHPLEEISNLEKMKSIEQADRRLTDAEMARTLAEENLNAIIFASVISDLDYVFGTEVQYLVDEHGDFYFQVDDDSDFIPTLNTAETYKQVVIGYGSIDDWVIEHEESQEDNMVEEIEPNSSDDESEEVWTIISPETVELALEELEHDSLESPGDWAGLNTLLTVHPMDFAERLCEASSTDYLNKIEKPSNNLRIAGEVRRLDGEEESYVQQIWYDRFRWDAEYNEDSEDTEDLEEEMIVKENVKENTGKEIEVLMPKGAIESSTMDKVELIETAKVPMPKGAIEASTMDNVELIETAEYSEVGVSFFKLEIKNIQLLRGYAYQSSVDLLEFRQSKPDVLAQSAPGIIERLNSDGKKVENAVKALCWQRKGLQVEEASLIGLDSYGVDLRVHFGREVQTLRISFSQRATSVDNAEQLLNQLLYPRLRHRGRRRRRSRSKHNP